MTHLHNHLIPGWNQNKGTRVSICRCVCVLAFNIIYINDDYIIAFSYYNKLHSKIQAFKLSEHLKWVFKRHQTIWNYFPNFDWNGKNTYWLYAYSPIKIITVAYLYIQDYSTAWLWGKKKTNEFYWATKYLKRRSGQHEINCISF